MQTTPKSYTDIDYESIADLDLDRHWVQLPNSVLAERRQARQQAIELERLAALPTGHKIILVPADPTYSPIEEELWPIINHTVQQCLRPRPELRSTINGAVIQAMAEHRGWRNPFPADLEYSPRPNPHQPKIINRKTNPAISFKTIISNPQALMPKRWNYAPLPSGSATRIL